MSRVPALESELTKFLCSVSCLHEAVHHKSDGSLWAVLSSAAEDAATWCSWCAWVPFTSWRSCCRQLCSFSVFVLGVAIGQCSWSCSSPNHPGGIADTVGPQFEDLQYCCLGEWTLLFSFHAPWRLVRRQCHIYVQDTLRWSFFGLYMAMFCIFISLSKIYLDTRSFPLESQYSWNTLFRCVREVITVSRYSFCESFRQ